MLVIIYRRGSATTDQCLEAARSFYADRPFVRVTNKPPRPNRQRGRTSHLSAMQQIRSGTW
ncbi:hypothetical protein [Paracoccus marcusii]|uniref:hypothetical protein n=1 Tax=Paracoccus marcusii TaxID=59779 RepID=UPI003CD0DA0F